MATSRITLERLHTAAERKPGLLTVALAVLDTWIERHRQRNTLLGLNDAMLKDIGISSADAMREGSKPFWSR